VTPSPSLERAWEAFNQGQFSDAIALARNQIVPSSRAEAQLLIGLAEIKLGNVAGGIEALTESATLEPGEFMAWNWLAFGYNRQGSYEQAAEHAGWALRCNPESADALSNLGVALIGLERYAEASDALGQAVALEPRVERHHYNLGRALAKAGRAAEAANAFQNAAQVARNPRRAIEAQLAALESAGNWPEVREAAQKLIRLNPQVGAGFASRGWAELKLGGMLGIELLRKAVELDRASHLYRLALGLQMVGQFDEAEPLFVECLRNDPNSIANVLLSLITNGVDLTKYPEFVQAAEEVLEQNRIEAQELPAIHFALGKHFDKAGEYEKAIKHYDAGNAAHASLRQRAGYPVGGLGDAANRILNLYERVKAAVPDAFGLDSEVPVLVVGMLRSGTTLLHQVLTSSETFAGAGELGVFFDGKISSPEFRSGHVDAEFLLRAATDYLGRLESFRDGADRVVDKLPGNYLFLGFINLVLPRVKFVHMVRDPLDTCFSIWTTPIANRAEWAFDRKSIVANYRAYLEVMAMWKLQLPPGVLLEVRYEDLVTDTERETRRIADFLGVEWSPDFLCHEEHAGVVLTPSVWQARQKMFTSSIGRGKLYEPWLAEFLELS